MAASTKIPSPKPSDKQKLPFLSSSSEANRSAAAAAYEHYLRLPQLSKLWTSKDFPEWNNESILKPSLQALEITFRLISIALSDPRPYANRREWTRRLDSLAAHQIELIATLLEDETLVGSGVPFSSLSSSSKGVVLARKNSEEVWKLPGAEPVLSRTSEESLLPRLATWDKSQDIASKIFMQIESHVRRCSFTLGLGEPNLSGKPLLEYDLIVRPSALHAFKKCPLDHYLKNYENQYLFAIHQILESWLFALKELLTKVEKRVEVEDWETAASHCWMAERIWKLLAEIEDLHLLMDPDDFLQLKNQLDIKKKSPSSSSSLGDHDAFYLRSAALVQVTKLSKNMRQMVPEILGAEADPYGGPRVQEAAMKLYHGRSRRAENAGKVHLLQGMQAVEAAVKRFYFGYEKVVAAVMGSLEWGGESVFMEPAYYPSLDAAKTFLGHVYWQKQLIGHQTARSNRCADLDPNSN